MALDRIGRYEIIEPLGEGGMAVVYRACIRGIGRASKEIALKVIHPHLNAERDFVLMFLDEMRVAMALAHRNIVQTFDVGLAEDRYFMAMELVDGCSVRELLGRLGPQRRCPLEIALFVGMEVCAALDYAHSYSGDRLGPAPGVIHRDISPGNVLLSAQGDVKLADFGIAKAAGRLTVSSIGMIKGKPGYVAPEQLLGRAEPRSDLYALGAVLYEMIGGAPLREEVSWEEICEGTAKIVALSEHRQEIPASLEALLMSAVRHDVQERPRSASDLRKALSEELFALQVERGTPSDPHADVRALLGELLPADRQRRRDERVDRVADALLREAEAVPTKKPAAEPMAAGGPKLAGPSVSDTAKLPDRAASRAKARAEGQGEETWVQDDEGPRPVVLRSRRREVALVSLAGLLLVTAIVTLVALGGGDTGLSVSEGHRAAKPLARADLGMRPDPDIRAASWTVARLPVDARRGAVMTASSGGGELQAARERPRRRGAKRPGKKRRVARAAEPRRGQLDVNAFPWARVFVDGVYRGDTPVQRLQLAAGAHELRLVNPDQRLSRTLSVVIVAGETVRQVIRLR